MARKDPKTTNFGVGTPFTWGSEAEGYSHGEKRCRMQRRVEPALIPWSPGEIVGGKRLVPIGPECLPSAYSVIDEFLKDVIIIHIKKTPEKVSHNLGIRWSGQNGDSLEEKDTETNL